MKSAVVLALGPHRLVMDIALVQEVAPRVKAGGRARDVFAWRERSVPIIDLHRLFGLPTPSYVQWVIASGAEDDSVVALCVDEVPGLMDMQACRAWPLPVTLARVADAIDRVWRGDGDSMLLQLHTPLNDLAELASGESHAE